MKKLIIVLIALFTVVSTYSQDILVTADGDAIKAYNVDLSASMVYYTLEPQSKDVKAIEKTNILVWKKSDGTKVIIAEEKESKPGTSNNPDIDLANFHGFLLEKGNCVFIPTNSKQDYIKVGQEHLKERMKEIGYWKVVDTPEQAHFVMQYYVDLRGKDTGIFYLQTRDTYKNNPSCIYKNPASTGPGTWWFVTRYRYTSEEPNDNILCVDNLLNDIWGKDNEINNITNLNKKFLYKRYLKEGFIIP